MGRTEKDFQGLVISTMDDIRSISSSNDITTNVEARNKYINTVNFLEDIISPYFNDNIANPFNPNLTGDEDTDIHIRLREIMRVAKDAGVITPLSVIEDLEESEFYIDDSTTAAEV